MFPETFLLIFLHRKAIRSLRCLNGRTLSPFPAEAGHFRELQFAVAGPAFLEIVDVVVFEGAWVLKNNHGGASLLYYSRVLAGRLTDRSPVRWKTLPVHFCALIVASPHREANLGKRVRISCSSR